MTRCFTRNNGVPRQHASEDAPHAFAVGQRVKAQGWLPARRRPTYYLITGKLPARANSPQYRIRNEEERHERVTTQEDLEPVNSSQIRLPH